jgi:hypothetical protein
MRMPGLYRILISLFYRRSNEKQALVVVEIKCDENPLAPSLCVVRSRSTKMIRVGENHDFTGRRRPHRSITHSEAQKPNYFRLPFLHHRKTSLIKSDSSQTVIQIRPRPRVPVSRSSGTHLKTRQNPIFANKNLLVKL